MIRRHITPALVSFALVIACFAARPVLGWTGALVVGLTAAAPGIVLLRSAAIRPGILACSAAVGMLVGAACLARMDNASARAFLPASPAQITVFRGSVAQDSTLSREGDTMVRLALSDAAAGKTGISGSAAGIVLLFVRGDYRFALGERLRVTGGLAAFESSGPETFSAGVSRADVRSEGFAGRLWEARAEARAWLHRAVGAAGYPASALLEALLTGAREDVTPELSEAFRRTGSLHILALSGLHVTVLYGLIAGILGFLRGRWLKFAIASVVLVFYQVLAGFMPSLLRATIMILVGGTALLLDRDAEPLNLLCIAGIVLALIDPFQVLTLSFQLSFLAIAGILVVGPLVQRPLEGKLPRIVLLPLAMSVGAQAGTLPLVVSAFGAWYPSGVLAGLVLVPLTTGLLWAGLAWLPLSLVPLPLLRQGFTGLFAALYRAVQGAADLFAIVPGVTFGGRVAPWFVAGSAAALVAVGVLLPRSRGKFAVERRFAGTA